jgi:hypothetical protein
MKEQINKIRDYFTNKLLSGEFEVVSIMKHYIFVKVDGYQFCIWIGNMDYPTTCGQYHGYDVNSNFMDLGISPETATKLHDVFDPIIKENYQKVIYNQRMKQYEELKKELKIN